MGKVYLVGAGPGDKELITVKAKRIIKEADVIVYDFLASKALLEDAKPGAELIYVGKRAKAHSFSQDEINELLFRKASEGKVVVRLKGGDPFIFGRGAEEALFLFQKGVEFEVIPGVTSAIAVPAYAGIPLTHRVYASTVAFVTGHEDEKKQSSRIKWEALKDIDTLVFLMGVKRLSEIKERLIEAGKSPDTKACLIEWGTLPEQRVVEGKLSDIDVLARREKIEPPSILVVGEVVNLRAYLSWYEKKPLFGKKIAILRPSHQKEEISKLLEMEGAKVLYLPVIEIKAIEAEEKIRNILDHLDSFFAIIFTSVNGVSIFFETFINLADIRELKGIKIFAIGPKTELALRKLGIYPEALPPFFTSEGIIERLKEFDLKGKKILLPRAEIAGEEIEAFIKKKGGIPVTLPLYKTIRSSEIKSINEKPDVICFTSSSTVKNFFEIYGIEPFKSSIIASIGPKTTKTLEGLGVKVQIEAKRHDIYGLVEAIKSYYGKK